MIQYINKYIELTEILKTNKIILKKYTHSINKIQKEILKNKKDMYNLINEKEELENCINQIIKNKITNTNQVVNFFLLILLITTIGTIAISNKFNVNIMLCSSLFSIIGIYSISLFNKLLLKKIYRKKDKKIKTIQNLINEKNIEINKYKNKNTTLQEEKRNFLIKYNNQKKKVIQIENLIKEIKIDYATPIFNNKLKKFKILTKRQK